MPLTIHALTTLNTVKNELEISLTDTSKDSVLERYINMASEAIERFCRRHFEYQANFVEKIAGQGGKRIVLSRTPVLSITEIKVAGSALSSDSYDIDNADAGIIYSPSGWPWNAGYAGYLTPDPMPGTESKNIEVTYTGGYVTPSQETEQLPRTLPYDLENACIETVKRWFLNRQSGFVITQDELGSETSKTIFLVNNLPDGVKQLLISGGWRRIV